MYENIRVVRSPETKKMTQLVYEGFGLFAESNLLKKPVFQIFHEAYGKGLVPILDDKGGRICVYTPEIGPVKEVWNLLPPKQL